MNFPPGCARSESTALVGKRIPQHSAPFGREFLQHLGRSWSIVDHHPVPQDQRRIGLNRLPFRKL